MFWLPFVGATLEMCCKCYNTGEVDEHWTDFASLNTKEFFLMIESSL